MAETVEDRLKIEVENYNNLNQKKKELEVDLGKINQDMLKILGKIELLQDLTEKKENKDGWFIEDSSCRSNRNRCDLDWMASRSSKSGSWDSHFCLYMR